MTAVETEPVFTLIDMPVMVLKIGTFLNVTARRLLVVPSARTSARGLTRAKRRGIYEIHGNTVHLVSVRMGNLRIDEGSARRSKLAGDIRRRTFELLKGVLAVLMRHSVILTCIINARPLSNLIMLRSARESDKGLRVEVRIRSDHHRKTTRRLYGRVTRRRFRAFRWFIMHSRQRFHLGIHRL